MKKWDELKSKGAKYQRIYRAAVDLEIREQIKEPFELYKNSKDEGILDEIRLYLIKRKRKFSEENRERIEFLLT